MTRCVCGVKMTRDCEMWKGTIYGYDFTAIKSGKYWYGNFPFSSRIKTLEDIVWRAFLWVIDKHFDEIVKTGWNGISIDTIDGDTIQVFFNSICIGTFAHEVDYWHIANCLVKHKCL